MPFLGYRPASSRNIGIQQARGDVILSLDFDMICHLRTVEEHLKTLHRKRRVATIGHRKFIDASSLSPSDILKNPGSLRRLPRVRSASNTGGGYYDKRLPEFALFRKHKYPFNCFHGCNVAYFRDDALDAGNWDTGFDGAYGYEDVEFGLRLWKNDVELVYNELAYGYHQENQVVSQHKKTQERHYNLEKLYGIIPKLRDYRRKLETMTR
jgi:GT2 family glycosyltransferase